MKKIIIVLILSILIMIFPTKAFASEGLIKPGSKFYFLQTWGESVRLFFTFSRQGKLDYLLDLSDRRIDELKNHPNISKELTRKIIARYEDHYRRMEEFANQVQNRVQVSEKIKDVSVRQQQILADIYQKVPREAQKGILTAQENSSKNVSNVIKKCEGEKAAAQYTERIQQIQQARMAGKAQIMPMESGGPAEDPSKTQHNPLNSVMGGKELKPINRPNQLNQTNDNSGGQGGNQVQPVSPAPINAPVGKN